MFEEILPRNEDDVISRYQLFFDEFNHPDNRLFFTMNVPRNCLFCEMDHGFWNEFETPEKLVDHVRMAHGEENGGMAILVLEAILQKVMHLKEAHLVQRGEFSN